MTKKRRFSFQLDFFATRIFTMILIAASVLFAVNLARMFSRDSMVRRELARLERETKRLEAEQKRLEDFRNFLKTDFFLEQESRKSLGYVKPGEQVVVIEGYESAQKAIPAASELSNPQKWWKYLFGANSEKKG